MIHIMLALMLPCASDKEGLPKPVARVVVRIASINDDYTNRDEATLWIKLGPDGKLFGDRRNEITDKSLRRLVSDKTVPEIMITLQDEEKTTFAVIRSTIGRIREWAPPGRSLTVIIISEKLGGGLKAH